VYNGLDTRVGSTTDSVSRTFLRDGAYVTDPVLKDGAAVYTPGISERRGTTTTFLHGGLKSVDAQSRPTQALSATRTYDAFGNATASSGTWRGPFGYAGGYGYQEDATGLRLLGHRFYDPGIGRFLTRDPVKDGRNWYVYCGNDPVNGADPEGLTARSVLRIVKSGIKVVTVIPAAVIFGLAVRNANEEASQSRTYKRLVSRAMDEGLDPETGQRLNKDNNPGMGGALGVIQKFWELLIEIA
jgi:RHS repeat-associated protein